MTHQPKPAPVKPKPITHDPHAGQLSVVVSFRAQPCDGWTPGGFADMLRMHTEFVAKMCDEFADLDVAVRVIGAGGEQAEDEGRYDQLTLTEDVEQQRAPWRDREDVDTGGKL